MSEENYSTVLKGVTHILETFLQNSFKFYQDKYTVAACCHVMIQAKFLLSPYSVFKTLKQQDLQAERHFVIFITFWFACISEKQITDQYCILFNTASDFKSFKFGWEPLQHMIMTQEFSLRDSQLQRDSLDSHTDSTYHIRAHLCSWPKYQFTLFIDIVYPSRQLLRETVWPRNGLVKQALTISCAIKK